MIIIVNTDISVGLVRTEDPDRPSSYVGGGNGALNSENNLGYSNVISYGAKGDGTTDDTIAIQAAIDSTMLNGGRVYFPDGNYVITKALHLYSGSVLIGSSQNSTKIIQHSEDNHIEGRDCNFVTIKDMCFDGLSIKSTNGGVNFDKINNTNIVGINMENIIIQHCTGLSVNSPVASIFNNVRVENNNGNGFKLYGSGSSITMNSCYAINCTQVGYELVQVSNSNLNSCIVELCGIGFNLTQNCNNVSLISCAAKDSAHAGIVAKGGSSTIIGYQETGKSQYGIFADEDAKLRIINADCSSPVHLPNN